MISSSVELLYVSYSVFCDCHASISTGYGGGVYFANGSGKLSRICTLGCSAYFGQGLNCHFDTNGNSFLNLSAGFHCPFTGKGGHYTFRCQIGFVIGSALNLSSNTMSSNGILTVSKTNNELTIQFSSIINNTSDAPLSMVRNAKKEKNKAEFMNFVSNKKRGVSYGSCLLYTKNVDAVLSSSVILNNNFKGLRYNEGSSTFVIGSDCVFCSNSFDANKVNSGLCTLIEFRQHNCLSPTALFSFSKKLRLIISMYFIGLCS